MRTFYLALAASLAAAAVPSLAATTILTFDNVTDPNPRPACSAAGQSGPTAVICSVETSKLGNDYGSTPDLAITYNRVVNSAGGPVNSPELLFLIADRNGVGSSFGGIGNAATITFTPTAGNQVSFGGFDYVDRNTGSPQARFTLTDAMGVTLFDFTNTVARTRTSYVANTGFFSGPLTLSFDGIGNSVPSVDNIILNTRIAPVVPPVGGVPEPATWALMIGGFGMVGGAMRRRSTLATVTA